MDKPMTFEEWWKSRREILMLTLTPHAAIASMAWKARDAELLALRKENQDLRAYIQSLIADGTIPVKSSLNNLVRWDLLTSTPALSAVALAGGVVKKEEEKLQMMTNSYNVAMYRSVKLKAELLDLRKHVIKLKKLLYEINYAAGECDCCGVLIAEKHEADCEYEKLTSTPAKEEKE